MLPMLTAIVTILIEHFAALSQGRDSQPGCGARLAKVETFRFEPAAAPLATAATAIANLVATLLDEYPHNLHFMTGIESLDPPSIIF